MTDTGHARPSRLTAFTTDPRGGNPAGVWIGTHLPSADEMQRIAADIGYSETAFLAPLDDRRYLVRYYSPKAEVSFCGHATIASGVELGERRGPGEYVFEIAVGEVPVMVTPREGSFVASLTSVDTRHRAAPAELLDESLAALRWTRDVLTDEIPPAVAYAGASHLVLALKRREPLDGLDYDFRRLERAMLGADLTTVQLVWRERPDLFHSRNPFPVGGVVEDPATGAAAAALGGYLRDADLIETPAEFVIRQGEVMGRPSRIEVRVPVEGGVTVTGAAVPIED